MSVILSRLARARGGFWKNGQGCSVKPVKGLGKELWIAGVWNRLEQQQAGRWQEYEERQPLNWSTRPTHSHDRSWSQFSRVVRLSVPTFQNLAKQINLSSEVSDRYWRKGGSGRVDHWWHLSCLPLLSRRAGQNVNRFSVTLSFSLRNLEPRFKWWCMRLRAKKMVQHSTTYFHFLLRTFTKDSRF